MANYPAPPGHRMAYDRDGTVMMRMGASNVPSQQTTGTMQALNREDDAVVIDPGSEESYPRYIFIFPQLRDLSGYFAGAYSSDLGYAKFRELQTSTDTTNGLDGTWTTRLTSWAASGTVSPYYRSAIQTVSYPGIKAIRFATDHTGFQDRVFVKKFHLYGTLAAGSEGDTLALWNPAIDQRIAAAALDFGDVPRSNVSQKQFRLKNRSATKTANNVVVGLEALTDATPSLGSQHQFSLDGSTWASSVTVTSIAPGAISPLVYVRRSTDAAAALSVWAARVTAVAGSWT